MYRNTGGGRDILLTRWEVMQDNWLSTWEKLKWYPYLTAYTQINASRINDYEGQDIKLYTRDFLYVPEVGKGKTYTQAQKRSVN